MKKLTSVLIVLALVLTMSVGVFAADTYADEAAANAATITAGTKITVAGVEYTAIDDAKQITDLAGSYYLIKDITWPEANIGDFTGSFNGGFHTITLSGDSMFLTVGGPNSVISNFTIAGEELIALADKLGPVATETHGGTYKNIANYVDILSSKEQVGGLFGTISNTSTSQTLVVENCVNYGFINGSQRSGGFLGAIGGITNMTSITFRNCVNHGEVSCDSNYYAGGILGSIQGVAVEYELNIENCVNNAPISATQSFVGGIIGGAYKANAVMSYVNITGCTNNGDITTTAASSLHYGTGGIFGGVDQSSVTINATACINNGAVSSVQIAGGIVGGVSKVGNQRAVKVTATNCINTGAVTISDTGFCSAIVTNQNGCTAANQVSPESAITVTDCFSTVADLKVNDILTALEDGTLVITPEITNAVTVADAAAAIAGLNGKVEDVTFQVVDGKIQVKPANCEYENGWCKVCGAPDPYNPIELNVGGEEGGEQGGEQNPTVTTAATTTKAPETTKAPTTTPVEEEKGGCKGFAGASVAFVALITTAGCALLKKKED